MNTYIIVRRDLKMRRGKEIAQACHAVLGLGKPDGPVITLSCPGLEALECVEIEAANRGWKFFTVRDLGKTEVPRGTKTVVAVYAPSGSFDWFKLY